MVSVRFSIIVSNCPMIVFDFSHNDLFQICRIVRCSKAQISSLSCFLFQRPGFTGPEVVIFQSPVGDTTDDRLWWFLDL